MSTEKPRNRSCIGGALNVAFDGQYGANVGSAHIELCGLEKELVRRCECEFVELARERFCGYVGCFGTVLLAVVV